MPYSPADLNPILYRVRTDISAIKTKDGTSIWKRNEPLTIERINAHLSGECLRGVCPIKEGESATQILMLDLDSHKGETSWDDMLQIAQNLYDTFAKHGVHFEGFRSSGGKGIHLYAVWDEPQDAYSVRHMAIDVLESINFSNGTGGVAKGEIEVFPKQNEVKKGGCGNQFILPYSPKGEPLSNHVEWKPSVPPAIVKKPEPKPKAMPLFEQESDIEKATNALGFIAPDQYDTWVMAAMALKDEFGDSGFAVWDSWSASSEKYNAREMWRKWQSFRNEGIGIGSLFAEATLAGWKPAPYEHPHIDTGIVDSFVERLPKAHKPNVPAPCKFDFDPLKIKGLIGDTVREIVTYSMYPQPELALLNVIAAAGALFGRKYASVTDTRTNVYIVGVANTASGKDFARQFISRLFEKAGLSNYIGAHYIRSDTGMLTSLLAEPSHIIMLDEFGMYLEAMENSRAPTHIRNVSTVLTKLFTCSNNDYNHGATVDPKSKIKILRPNLCLYATTTEDRYAQSLKKEAIDTGALNRFIAFKSNRRFTGHEPESPKFEISEPLASAWAEYGMSGKYIIPNLSEIPPDPITVEESEEASQIKKQCRVKQQSKCNEEIMTSGLWGRYAELVTKIAMILAIADNIDSPCMTEYHFKIAQNIVDVCMNYMVSLADGHLSDNDYEASQQKILKFLRSKKNGAAMAELHNKFRSVKSRDRREMLLDMVGQGVISIDRVVSGAGGRPAEVVRAI